MQTSQGNKIVQAINSINRNTPSLNKFFEEFDVYDGRVFEVWELEQILGGSVSSMELERAAEEN